MQSCFQERVKHIYIYIVISYIYIIGTLGGWLEPLFCNETILEELACCMILLCQVQKAVDTQAKGTGSFSWCQQLGVPKPTSKQPAVHNK